MSDDLFSNPFIQDILAQPLALSDTLSSLKKPSQYRYFSKLLENGALRRIILTGMGSSFYAAYPTYLTLLKQGFPVQLIETSELIHSVSEILVPDTLLIAVSQSGETVEILRLIDLIKARVPLIGVTNSALSTLAKCATATIVTKAGEERSVSCKTYITALATLPWLVEILINGEPKKIIKQFVMIPEKIYDYLSKWQIYYDELVSVLSNTKNLFLLGRGSSLAAANTGALIIKEAAGFCAEGMSSASFRHGPLEVISRQVFVVIYLGSGLTAEFNMSLATEIQQKIPGMVATIRLSTETGLFNIPPISSIAIPILEILPAQLISLALARITNHKAGLLNYSNKVTSIE